MPDAAARLHAIRSAIADAAREAKRDPKEIALVAVSKNRSIADIEALIEAGQRNFCENRVQEAASKWPELRRRHPDIVLHMIGRLADATLTVGPAGTTVVLRNRAGSVG